MLGGIWETSRGLGQAWPHTETEAHREECRTAKQWKCTQDTLPAVNCTCSSAYASFVYRESNRQFLFAAQLSKRPLINTGLLTAANSVLNRSGSNCEQWNAAQELAQELAAGGYILGVPNPATLQSAPGYITSLAACHQRLSVDRRVCLASCRCRG